MRSFQEFVRETALNGAFNPVFAGGMHSLTNDLERIIAVLEQADVPFAVVGGAAVNAHLLPHHRSRSFVTPDINLLVRRDDLDRLRAAAEASGYAAEKRMGGYMLIRPGQLAGEAVHLLFSEERSKSTQPFPHPALSPQKMPLFGLSVPAAPLVDLVTMKLNSFRPKDRVHLQVLEEAGLITPALESSLPEVLRERLHQARQEFAEGEPDVWS